MKEEFGLLTMRNRLSCWQKKKSKNLYQSQGKVRKGGCEEEGRESGGKEKN